MAPASVSTCAASRNSISLRCTFGGLTPAVALRASLPPSTALESTSEHLERLPGPLGTEPAVDQGGDPLAHGQGVDAGKRPVPEPWEDVAVEEASVVAPRNLLKLADPDRLVVRAGVR